MKSSIRFFSVLSIFIVSAILRFYNLEYRSVWLDEGWSIGAAQNSWSDLLFSRAYSGHLFNVIITKTSAVFFGYSEFSIRFFPALLGSLTIIPVYLVTQYTVGNTIVSLFTSLLVAINPLHNFYSQECAVYSSWAFFFLFAVLFYCRYIDYKKRKDFILLHVLLTFCLYAHLYTVFIIFIMYLSFLIDLIRYEKEQIYKIKTYKQYLFGGISILIASLPVLKVYIEAAIFAKLGGADLSIYSIFHDITYLRTYTEKIVAALFNGPSNSVYMAHLPYEFPYNYKSWIIYILLFIYLSINYIFFKNHKRYIFIPLVMIAYPILIILNSHNGGYVFERYFLPFVILNLILISNSIFYLFNVFNKRYKAIPILLFFLLIGHYGWTLEANYYNHYNKSDWRGISKIVKDDINGKNAPIIIFNPINWETEIIKFYLGKQNYLIFQEGPYYNYYYDDRVIFLSQEEEKQQVLDSINRITNLNPKNIYIFTYRGRFYDKIISEKLKDKYTKEVLLSSHIIVNRYSLVSN